MYEYNIIRLYRFIFKFKFYDYLLKVTHNIAILFLLNLSTVHLKLKIN